MVLYSFEMSSFCSILHCYNVYSLLCFHLSLLPEVPSHCISRGIRFHRFFWPLLKGVFFLWFFVYVLAHQSNLGTYDGVLLELWQRCNLARMHLHQMTVWRILNKLSHWMSRVSESQNSTWYHVKEALKRFSKVLFGVLLNMISQSVEIFIWSTDSRVKTISFFPWLTLTVKE